jgi:hypothetical protein
MKSWLLAVMVSLFAISVQAQTSIVELIPPKVNLQTNGLQIPVVVRGNNLNKIKKVEAWYEGQPDSYIFAQLGTPSANRVSVTLIARPDSPIGSLHQLRFLLEDGSILNVPLPLRIVANGDPDATQPDTAAKLEQNVEKSGQRKVIESNKAPIVTATVPKPLYVVPNGQVQTLTFKGLNLDQVVSVRIRKADTPPRYRNKEGELPFRHVKDGLEVDVVSTPDTPIGTKYCIDLLLEGNYLAGTLTFPIQNPPNPGR